MVNENYQNAYTEVWTILKYVSKTDMEKIPKKLIKFFADNRNKAYNFKYNPSKNINEQNISETAKYIIAILFRDYWATPEQKNKILAKEKYDLEKIEEDKGIKYNKNIFEERQKKDESYIEKRENEIVVVKKNFIQKILEKINNIFNKNNA